MKRNYKDHLNDFRPNPLLDKSNIKENHFPQI